MQHGFSSKKNKNKKNKQKKKAAKEQQPPKNGDDMEMQEEEEEIDYTMPKAEPEKLTGKAAHLHKIQLKKQLKVKVAQLKQHRCARVSPSLTLLLHDVLWPCSKQAMLTCYHP